MAVLVHLVEENKFQKGEPNFHAHKIWNVKVNQLISID